MKTTMNGPKSNSDLAGTILMKENLFIRVKGNTMSDFMMQQIEQRMATRGIDLNLLSDEELSAVAVRFLGDAPPGHLLSLIHI